jgi:hypothetical protein
MRRAKKAIAKGRKGNAKQSTHAQSAAQQADQNQENVRNEYGIFPNRDLKKNLGCG